MASMRKNARSIKSIHTATLLIMAFSGCRTSPRTQTSPNDPIAVEIRTVNMQDADKSRPDFIYTLNSCGEGSANGVKLSDTVLQFQTRNVKKDDSCDLNISSSKSSAAKINWFGEQGLMYQAKKITIGSTEGKLKGLAILQQLYAYNADTPIVPGTPNTPTVPTTWTLKFNLKTPKAIQDICTCTLSCSPAVPNNISKVEIASDKISGTCSVSNTIKPEFSKTECTKVSVQCGSDFYVGKWPASTTIDGSAAKDSSLPDITLTAGTPEATNDASIEVIVPKI